ncbi:hypothetical protein C0Q70_10924 [Pomacea canaliculata]|uniref:Uncharacterized protein n=1 Tax=Pomacea canaliculata TaxID=400727 RepID=A0A2T7P4I7_POMCA|nr:hypothetical protein C0Q70_10924 [Pomacea canaliculata]
MLDIRMDGTFTSVRLAALMKITFTPLMASGPEDRMDFDDILTLLGDWGRYQKRFYFMVTLPIAFKGLQVMMVVFTVFVPKHRELSRI